MKKALAFVFILCLMSGTLAIAQTGDACLDSVKKMKVQLPSMMEGIKKLIHSMMPDPAAYEKTLPPWNKVIADKDLPNFKNYGGLAEAYYYAGDKTNGERLFLPFQAKASTMLEASDNYAAGVIGDIGFLYFEEGDLKHAEPLLLSAIKQIEPHMTPSIANNLITDYLCIACLRDQQGKADDAKKYAKKLVDLAQQMREPQK